MRWRLNKELIGSRTEFWNQVPIDHHFLFEFKPLILNKLIPRDLCHQFIEQHKEKKRKQSQSPNGKNGKAIVLKSYKNTEDVIHPDFSIVSSWWNPQILKIPINNHWNLNFDYDWADSFGYGLYTIYKKDMYCKKHLDVIIGEDGILQRHDRRLTVLGYLSDWSYDEDDSNSFSGGDLIFPSIINEDDQMFTYRPKAGDIVVFPANPNYHHLVTRMLSGERHTILNALKIL